MLGGLASGAFVNRGDGRGILVGLAVAVPAVIVLGTVGVPVVALAAMGITTGALVLLDTLNTTTVERLTADGGTGRAFGLLRTSAAVWWMAGSIVPALVAATYGAAAAVGVTAVVIALLGGAAMVPVAEGALPGAPSHLRSPRRTARQPPRPRAHRPHTIPRPRWSHRIRAAARSVRRDRASPVENRVRHVGIRFANTGKFARPTTYRTPIVSPSGPGRSDTCVGHQLASGSAVASPSRRPQWRSSRPRRSEQPVTSPSSSRRAASSCHPVGRSRSWWSSGRSAGSPSRSRSPSGHCRTA